MKGKLIIVSAPSGSGKTTIVKHLLKSRQDLAFSVSACNRPMRVGEIDGKDYYFLSTEEFKKKIGNDEFLEWEEVYENCFYGTLKSEIQRIWNEGKHVIFDVDVKGGINIKSKYKDKALALFIMPPSIIELEKRLRYRNTETVSTIHKRVARAKEEMSFADMFDKIIVNDKLEDALREADEAVKGFL